ncbi:hypothetical protein E4O04_08840 [Treponema sp. OMZ 799]|uniref:hypothetical protein n=1 Tax=Treponema sp. OMZ 799 TaxID=2563668 RepID=UPI0020A56AEF|nr:hypothetical protein [Treponema sp. OMZ 799]UTC78098.1 hypothetical protein E4O04_08840 [Treponema sp. OMZ 799]
MNHKKIFLCCIVLVVILASCKQGFIKKVKIKANPQIKVNLGSKEVNLGNIVYDNINKTLKDKDNLHVYKYTPKNNQDNILHYLFHYSVPENKINMANYIQSIEKATEGQTITINQKKIRIPTINIEGTSGTLPSISNPGTDKLTLNESINITNFNPINVSVTDLDYAVIQNGNIKITVEGLDDTLKKALTIKYENITINHNGGPLTPIKNKDKLTGELDLHDKTITNDKKIEVSGKINISGTIPAGYAGGNNLKLKVEAKIERLKEIKIKNQNIETVINKDITLDADISTYVKKITLNPISINANIKNKLPKDTDIKIKLDSEALNIHSEFVQFKANPDSNEGQKKTIFEESRTLTPTGSLDIKATLKIKGYDQANKTLTLQNIAPENEYSFGGEANIKFDFEKAVVTPSGENFKINNQYPVNTDIFKNNEILSKMNPKPINAYIYLVSDLAGSEAPILTTKIDLLYSTKTQNIINEDHKSTPFVSDPNFNQGEIPQASINENEIKLEDIFESKPKQIEFKIDMNLNQITVTNNALENIKKNNNKAVIKAHALFDVPLTVSIKNDIIEKVLSIKDILSRKAGENIPGQFDKITDTIKELNLIVEYTNNTGMIFDARIYNPEWKEGGIFQFEKKLKLKDKGSIHINLSKKEIQDIKKRNQFPIVIEVKLPKDSEINIKNGTLNFSAYTITNMDVTYEF